MKKFLTLILSLVLVFTLLACTKTADYQSAAELEAALNSGVDVTGKIVTFAVDKVVPNSAFGYNLQAGEHLNFCSDKNPNVQAGDTVTVKITEVSSVLGSYIIYYKKA